MKKYVIYSVFFVVATILNSLVVFLVPPVRAMCDCIFNDMQDVLFSYVSVFAALLAVFLTQKRKAKGMSYSRAFTKSTLLTMGIMALLSIMNFIIFG